MNDGKSSSTPFNWPQAFLLLAVGANVFWIPTVLKSSRPPERISFQTLHAEAKAEARLWQDPFEAVDQKFRAAQTNGSVPPLSSIWAKANLPGATNLTVLAVMVTGSPYAEGAELRLRSRYAVASALAGTGYIPDDPEHVFYAGWVPLSKRCAPAAGDKRTPNSSGKGDTGCCDEHASARKELTAERNCESSNAVPVPYERFKTKSESREVVVVWLQDEIFGEQFLTQLHDFFSLLTTDWPATPNRPSLNVLGPWGSTTLKELWRGATNTAPYHFTALSNCTIYSSSATCADHSIDQRIPWRATDDGYPARSNLVFELKRHGINFRNVICTDDQLSRVLIEELQLRGVQLVNGNDRVALLSEWDTDYGRELPNAFVGVLTSASPNPAASFPSYCWWPSRSKGTVPVCGASKTNQVVRFTYLRGVDGKVVDSDGSSAGKKETTDGPKSSAADKQKRSEEVARPEGRAQLDYVPRLVRRIQEMDTNANLKAIGILGSDVYDKLLLLQSLRENFPSKLFFTTDLDARLAHPRELKWSRNLIVASSFPLQLTGDLQGGTPPFRDNYQTALFLAARAAVDASVERRLTNAFAPVMFEIGQRGPHQLRRAANNESVAFNPPAPDPFQHLKRHWPFLAGIVVCGAGLLILSGPNGSAVCWAPWFAFFAWAKFGRRWLHESFGNEVRSLYVAFASLAFWGMLAGLIVAIWRDAVSPFGEPFTITAGISVWPTEILRIATALLCLIFFVLAWRDLKRNRAKFLWEDFIKPFQRETDDECFCKALRHCRDALSITLWRKKKGQKDVASEGNKEVEAREVMLGYEFRTLMRCRSARMIAMVLLYLAFGVFLFVFFGTPGRPIRGDIASITDFAALTLSVVAFVLLLFFVVDATRLCCRVTERLTEAKTNWGEAFKGFVNSRHIPKEYLDEWMDMEFITRSTKPVMRLIYYPFVVLTLMILARNHYFDAWDWPPALLLIFGCNSTYAAYCALRLRGAAERARGQSLESLRQKLSQLRGRPMMRAELEHRKHELRRKMESPEDKSDVSGLRKQIHEIDLEIQGLGSDHGPELARQIEEMIEHIERTEEGALAPLSQHPVVGAAIMPFGGAGILAVLEYLATH